VSAAAGVVLTAVIASAGTRQVHPAGPFGGASRVAGESSADELPAPFEDIQQGERAVRPGQGEAGVNLDYRQVPPGRGDRVAFVGSAPSP
jgi:hypothetical protein